MSGAPEGTPRPLVIVVMGVSGSGKTTVGELLGARLGWPYADADVFHPAANVEKMRAGVPLDDTDRAPWLGRIAAWIEDRLAAGEPGVVSCSALRRRYRDELVVRPDRVRLVYLHGDHALIKARMEARSGHFFGAGMLESQFRTLEPPEPDENALWVSVDNTPDDAVQAIVTGLGLAATATPAPTREH